MVGVRSSAWTWVLTLLYVSTFTKSAVATNDAPTLNDEICRASNDSLLWGPYRPNLYFGVRPRLPKSLIMGLLWAKVDDYQHTQNSKFSKPRMPD